MADDAATATNTGTEPATEETATEPLGDAGKKALESERREKRAAEKRAVELETRLKEFEDRDKSEAQRLLERAEAAEKRILETELRAMRLEVAADKGLTPAQAKRLVGSTREELEADATELLDTFKTADPGSGAVAASLDLGARGPVSAKAGPESDFAKFLSGQLPGR